MFKYSRYSSKYRLIVLTAVAALLELSSSQLQAEIVDIDFSDVPLPSTQFGALSLPYTKQGIRLTSNASTVSIVGTANSAYSGVKAFTPGTFSNLQQVNLSFEAIQYRFFAIRSVTLHPYASGQSVNIPFVGRRGFTVAQSATRNTGTSLAGSIVTFPTFFDQVVSLEFNMTQASGVYNRFQISRVLLEYHAVLTSASSTVSETNATATVPFTLDSPRSHDTEISWQIVADTATQGTDYTLPGGSSTGAVTIPAGQTVAYISVPITNDTTVESPETFKVRSWSDHPEVGNGVIESIVTITSLDDANSFPKWMTAHGLSGSAADAGADPNSDGITNIEAWLFKLNPNGINTPAELSRQATLSGSGINPSLTMTIPTPLPSDVRIIFSQSADLTTWSEQTRRTGFASGSLWQGSGSSRVIESATSTARTITLRSSVPSNSRPKLFLKNNYEYVPSGSGNGDS